MTGLTNMSLVHQYTQIHNNIVRNKNSPHRTPRFVRKYILCQLHNIAYKYFFTARRCDEWRGMRRLSVCISVRPLVTSRSYIEIAKRRIPQTTSHDNTWNPVFWRKKNRKEIRLWPPPKWAPKTGGVGQNRRFSTNISLHLMQKRCEIGTYLQWKANMTRMCALSNCAISSDRAWVTPNYPKPPII